MPYTRSAPSGDFLHYHWIGYVANKMGSPSPHTLFKVRLSNCEIDGNEEMRCKSFKGTLDEGKYVSELRHWGVFPSCWTKGAVNRSWNPKILRIKCLWNGDGNLFGARTDQSWTGFSPKMKLRILCSVNAIPNSILVLMNQKNIIASSFQFGVIGKHPAKKLKMARRVIHHNYQ